jgi:hypothetical protein
MRFSVLARDRRFDELVDLLSSLQKKTNHDDNHHNDHVMDVPLPLHYLLRHQPPLSIVNRLLQQYENIIKPEQSDKCGRNALHTACYYNADVSVIARLVNHHREDGGITNLNIPDRLTNRYPLHFLCDHYDASLATSALFLRDVLPAATLHRDVNGQTPADILAQQQGHLHSPTSNFSPAPTATQNDKNKKLARGVAATPPPPAVQAFTKNAKADKKKKKKPNKALFPASTRPAVGETPAPLLSTTTATAPSTLHIPIQLVATLSDLTESTAFLLMNNNNNLVDLDQYDQPLHHSHHHQHQPRHHHHHHDAAAAEAATANNVSLHSKSTCSTTTDSEEVHPVPLLRGNNTNTNNNEPQQQQRHEEQQQQQRLVVNAVRKQLSKHQVETKVNHHQYSNKTMKIMAKQKRLSKSNRSTIDESSQEDDNDDNNVPDDEYDDATAPLLPQQLYHYQKSSHHHGSIAAYSNQAEDWESVRC